MFDAFKRVTTGWLFNMDTGSHRRPQRWRGYTCAPRIGKPLYGWWGNKMQIYVRLQEWNWGSKELRRGKELMGQRTTESFVENSDTYKWDRERKNDVFVTMAKNGLVTARRQQRAKGGHERNSGLPSTLQCLPWKTPGLPRWRPGTMSMFLEKVRKVAYLSGSKYLKTIRHIFRKSIWRTEKIRGLHKKKCRFKSLFSVLD